MSDLANVMVERRGEVQVVRLAGEVDISNAARLEEDISGAVPNDASGLVLDLTDTGYLDSAGIRMLFELGERLGGRRQSVAVVVPRESVIRHSLVVTELDKAIPMHDSLDAAVAALATG
jgi:anti-sigma B factor antagonist